MELRSWLLANESAGTETTGKASNSSTSRWFPAAPAWRSMRENYQRDLRLLMGITGLVLLIACANLANLQLARGAASAGQTSIRVALGRATCRGSSARCWWRARCWRSLAARRGCWWHRNGGPADPARIPRRRLSFPSTRRPRCRSSASRFCSRWRPGLSFGLAPAWSASRADPAAALTASGRPLSGRSTLPQKTLVVLQAALSLVLLAGAGLMVQTLHNLTAQQFGLSDGRRHGGECECRLSAATAPEKLTSIYGEVDRQVRQIPGVRNVGAGALQPDVGQ